MDITALHVSLSVLAASLAAVFLVVVWRTRHWEQGKEGPPLKGLALPEGSVRGLIALIVLGAFVIFLFFGKGAVVSFEEITKLDADRNVVATTRAEDTTLFTTGLTALGTLTAAVAGFYFGGRSAQTPGGGGGE